MPHDRDSVNDILDSITLVAEYVRDISRSEFDHDLKLQDAVIRRIEVMGEAAKRISDQTRSRFPAVPWKDMAGMRDRVIHGYDLVDLNVVWDTIRRVLPVLKGQLESLLGDLDSAETG